MPYSYSREQELSNDVWNPHTFPNNAHLPNTPDAFNTQHNTNALGVL